MSNIEKMRVKFMKVKTFDEYKKLVIDKNGNYTGYPDVVFYIEETKECWVNGISYSGTDAITQLNKVLTDMINTKQETLVSGKNIKTINDKSIIVTDSSDTNISLTDIGVPNIDKTVLIDTYQTITGSKNFTNKNTFTEIEVSDKIAFTGNVGRYLYIPTPTLITNLNADYLGGIKHNLVQDNINKRLDASQSVIPNAVWIGPASGVTPTKATFRTLVENDIPNIDIAKVYGITEALAKKSNTGHTHTWQSLTNKPTTVAEAGLLDAITTFIFNKAVDTLIVEDTSIRKLIIDTCFTKDEANILRNSLIEVDNQIKTDLSTNYYNTTSIDKFLKSIRKGYNDGDTALDTKFTQLIENINTNIGDINSSSINTIKGSNSINVERINNSATISNKLSTSNNMLSIADDGLLVNGKLVYESSTGMLHLQNTGGTDIGEPVDLGSEYLAAWFRWKDNRIQISRDNQLTWENLSDEFLDNLRIQDYVETIDKLPTNASLGSIYMVGPDSKGKYRLHVNSSTGWIDNGEFAGLSVGVVQKLGQSITEVPSQKLLSDELENIYNSVQVITEEEYNKLEIKNPSIFYFTYEED